MLSRSVIGLLHLFVTTTRAISYLPFLNLGSSASIFTGVDDRTQSVSLPSLLKFGDNTYSTAYISSNGLISLGRSYISPKPQTFPISNKVIAPYWTDIDLRQQGQINYTLVTTQSNDTIESIALVNNFLASNISVSFSAGWILVAQWIDVCPYRNSDCSNVQPNSFQVVLASQGITSYSIFTYECNKLGWTRSASAAIGFSVNDTFYENHPLSRQSQVNNIACLNSPISNWSNVIYKIDSCNLTCGLGETVNSTCTGCVLINICLRNTPCKNGGNCTLGSVPDEYTCDCSGTDYTGKNCSAGRATNNLLDLAPSMIKNVPSLSSSNTAIYLIVEPSLSSSNTVIYVIVGAVGGGVIIITLLIIVILIVCVYKCYQKNEDNRTFSDRHRPQNSLRDNPSYCSVSGDVPLDWYSSYQLYCLVDYETISNDYNLSDASCENDDKVADGIKTYSNPSYVSNLSVTTR